MSAPAQVSVQDPNARTPAPSEVLAQLERLLAGRPLRESHQLQSFLEFVVRETLAGRPDGLKEYLIGCQVFGRKRDYDPRHDGIVRVQATSLRKRLEKYYADEGAADPVAIDLPRGGYVPTFHYRVAESEVPEAPLLEAVPAVAPAPVDLAKRRPSVGAFALGVAITLAACAAWISLRPT